ncbi:glycosyltransferase family 50 protein [Aspergillus aculeatus ATCC 16872]|uniref:GPI mannosyltransferase 1 n=1 Tax=Aspergillus aculeatus (strain ATCC 16872 / CBS 172.66 / WB 5094) TaxID=690307 RepID=A0A1L9WJ79_ASPA1|nr:glycosyltransferase family 50 protein [Aspergillus aculeatus ATCC 16872]OJJ96218.1 glycosyltransferase family 50 protein [Aspergillus aculeatus ATCC 16872]
MSTSITPSPFHSHSPSPPKPSPSTPPPSKSKNTLFTPRKIYPLALLLRLTLLLYGTYQDAHSALKYTDIDYLVFTDAARFTAGGGSPYDRATYRYTPLLAWVLIPTTWEGWFSFGKVMFAVADVVAGWLLARTLVVHQGMAPSRALRYASVWLLNPMVANISTRGSSEGVLGLITAGVVYLVLGCAPSTAGIVLGVGVHVKIYPFVYGVSVLLFLDNQQQQQQKRGLLYRLMEEITPSRLTFTASALLTFLSLNALMYHHYGGEFLQHTFLHHLTRVDHRHNFSVYASLLYDSAAAAAAAAATAAAAPGGAAGAAAAGKVSIESWAFLPQLLLSVLVIPFALAKRSLPGAMLAQTFAFVAFNKVCTSQYFLWYLIFLPLYLPYSSFLRKPRLGVGALGAWVVAQALWLQQGYNLEFLGLSTFVPGLFVASLGFFAVNVWILGVIVQDVGGLQAGGGGF